MTNYESAVAQLKTVKTVEEWNEIREQLKPTLTPQELGKIDGSGLIVQILDKVN